MKKKGVLVLVICIVAVSAIVVFGNFDGDMSIAQRIGTAFKKATNTNQTSGTGDSVAARYGDFVVTWEEIRYQQEIAPTRTQKHYQTTDAREIAERLIGGQLALEEAEQQELAATDQEIQEYMQSLRENYETIPEVKAQIDEFCASAGQTLEEYLRDAIFANAEGSTVQPDAADSRGLAAFLQQYTRCLAVERAAADAMQ